MSSLQSASDGLHLGHSENEKAAVLDSVRNYYGQVLEGTKDLKTSACKTSCAPSSKIRQLLKLVPEEVNNKYYGCGSPFPVGMPEGHNVLDLGCGSGRDCYVASMLVGPTGSVIGLDMTDEQLEVARSNVQEFALRLGYQPALKFVKGFIEKIVDSGIAPNSLDLIISNCVVNLSPDKRSVLDGAFKALKEGGEFYFSDVYSDRRLSESARKHEVLVGECIGGALYVQDFITLCKAVGFSDPRELERSEISVSGEIAQPLGNAKFYSITYRLFKSARLEQNCEDFGQAMKYNGSISSCPHGYQLDKSHYFETGRFQLICGNTAAIIQESWLKDHFTIVGDQSRHFGEFDCSHSSTVGSCAVSMSKSGCC